MIRKSAKRLSEKVMLKTKIWSAMMLQPDHIAL
jgi:hypothetical protein